MTTTTATAAPPVLGVLARQEIRNYLRSKLFWAGAVLLTAATAATAAGAANGSEAFTSSTATDMIAPAALLGLFGLIVMAGLTKRSDDAAAAAGTVAVPERTRTLALTAAVVVPLVAALVWFAVAVAVYLTYPPAPSTVPFGPIGDGFVLTTMFAIGVLPAVSGPILGLLLARWLPRRGVTSFALVLVVIVTILMQGNFEAQARWRVVWPWTYWYGPIGWNTGTSQWLALPGSPQLWLVYLLALCALGVLAAVYHDPESDRARLRTAIVAVVVLAVAALVLTMTLGLGEVAYNPIPVPNG